MHEFAGLAVVARICITPAVQRILVCLTGRHGFGEELQIVLTYVMPEHGFGVFVGSALSRQTKAGFAQELQRRLFEAGVISEIKPPITDLTPYQNRRAIPIQGDPISETVIRERR